MGVDYIKPARGQKPSEAQHAVVFLQPLHGKAERFYACFMQWGKGAAPGNVIILPDIESADHMVAAIFQPPGKTHHLDRAACLDYIMTGNMKDV
jgi:hypothetical protein